MPVGLLGELTPRKPSAINPTHVQTQGPCPIYPSRGTMEHTAHAWVNTCVLVSTGLPLWKYTPHHAPVPRAVAAKSSSLNKDSDNLHQTKLSEV